MQYNLAFHENSGEHYFTVTTTRSSYTHKIGFLSMHWCKQHLFKLGLDPDATIPRIIDAYLKWNNGEKQK
jgi:hypothetical protein